MKKFKVEFSPSNALKICVKNNIKVVDIKKLSFNECEITVENKECKKMCKSFNLKKLKLNIFLIATFIFFVLFCSSLFFVSNYILKIEINATSSELQQEAFDLISKQVKIGSKKSNIDIQALKSELLQNEKISLCDVKVVGLVLYVNIKQNEAIPDKNFEPIVSSVDGVVESVNLISGTSLVEKGSYVKKGDLLIVPEIVVNDEIVKTRALGEVVVLAYAQKTQTFLENRVEYEETGKIFEQKYFTILNNFVKINNGKLNFLTYQKTVTKKQIKIGFFPVQIFVEKYFETRPVSVKVNFEDVKDVETARVLEELKKEVITTEAIYSENVQYKKLSSGVYQIIATVQYPIVVV